MQILQTLSVPVSVSVCMQANIYHYMHLSAQYMVLGSISCVLKCGHRCISSLRMLCEMFGINLLGCASQLYCIDMW